MMRTLKRLMIAGLVVLCSGVVAYVVVVGFRYAAIIRAGEQCHAVLYILDTELYPSRGLSVAELVTKLKDLMEKAEADGNLLVRNGQGKLIDVYGGEVLVKIVEIDDGAAKVVEVRSCGADGIAGNGDDIVVKSEWPRE